MAEARTATALDSSAVVAALSPWHEHHAPASKALDDALAEPELVVVPAHVLVESFSVLTRLPPPHRVRPSAAWAALSGTFEAVARRPSLDGSEIGEYLGTLAREDVGGGAVYDALIVFAARSAGAERILTLNAAHLRRFAVADLEVVDLLE